MPKCPVCAKEVEYPRIVGKFGTYHFECFRKSGETVGSAYLSPPSQQPVTVAVMEESKTPGRRGRRKRR